MNKFLLSKLMKIILLFLFYLQLDIVQQEYIHEEGLDQFEVVKAAFDARGDWLATVEERRKKGAELEINLKLWEYDKLTQGYYLFLSLVACCTCLHINMLWHCFHARQ